MAGSTIKDITRDATIKPITNLGNRYQDGGIADDRHDTVDHLGRILGGRCPDPAQKKPEAGGQPQRAD